LFAACNKHDGEQFIDLWMPDMKKQRWYRNDREVGKKGNRTLLNVIKWPGYHLTTKREDVKVIVGKRTVFVYTKIGSIPSETYFMQFEGDKGLPRYSEGPMVIARLEGKWVVM
jgi:hypothetical protein